MGRYLQPSLQFIFSAGSSFCSAKAGRTKLTRDGCAGRRQKCREHVGGKEVGVALDTLKSTGIVDQGCPCCGSSLHEGLAVNSISGRVASCLFERKSWSFSGLGHAVSQQPPLHELPRHLDSTVLGQEDRAGAVDVQACVGAPRAQPGRPRPHSHSADGAQDNVAHRDDRRRVVTHEPPPALDRRRQNDSLVAVDSHRVGPRPPAHGSRQGKAV